MITLILAYGMLICFFAMDFVIRKDKNARSVENSEDDKKSTVLILLTFFVVLFLSVILNLMQIGNFEDEKTAVCAISLMLLGMLIRIHSMLTLSLYYTRTLVTAAEQSVVKKGLYCIIRHPGYLGTILVWGAAGLAMQNMIIFVLAFLLVCIAYSYRIYHEEKMLVVAFGDAYRSYQKKSWRLLPFIW